MFDFINEFKKRSETIRYEIQQDAETLGYDPSLIFKHDIQSLLSEQFQMIRTNLSLAMANEDNLKTVLFTSSMASEGKSLTSANLALSFSKDSEKKTLLIDADMRRPRQNKLFNLEREPGLSDILTGKKKLEEFIEKPVFDQLWIIPAGSFVRDPREIIGSAIMKNTLETLKEKFDYILVDSPPILSVSDSLIIASLVDISVLIVRANLAQEKQVKDSLHSLKEANSNLIGAIMTGFVEYSSYYSRSYKYRYRYYQRKKILKKFSK